MNLSQLQCLGAEDAGELMSRLLAIADDAVVVADAQYGIVMFNDGAVRIFGYAEAQALGRPLAMLLPESMSVDHASLMRSFGRSPQVARRMGERRQIHGRRADGSHFDAEASISHVELDDRVYYTAIVRDVSEARRAERALIASESRFRCLAEAAPVGIFQADVQGRLHYANDRWCEIAGMGAAEAAGIGWMRALHPADRGAVKDAWDEAVARRQPFDARYRFLRPDGTEVWVIGKAVVSRDATGEVNGLIGTVTDVTESHLQSQALERAKSEAEAAARAKSLFLANMSHEIRTPLNAVIGMTTLLLDTPMNDDQRDFAQTIRASGENLLEIINDILDYSKADVGKLEIEQHPFDLRRCIEESLDLVTPRALEKGLNLAYIIEDGTPEMVVGDAVRVRQILVNLLSNAVKFTHHGEVFVTAEALAADAQDLRLRFSVKDTGIGIAADQLPRLFQSFTQVDPSTTRKYGGTGLGLAISKRLAELMGGSVSVESEPGHGAEFRVELMVKPAAPAEPADFLRRNAPGLAGKRVLIVDDNLTNRRIVTKLALLWGMVPSTLPSALEALDRVRHGEVFDIAVLDMSMPGFDGVDLAKEIRRRRGKAELPIVMLTSLGQRHALQAGEAVQLSACLSKPIKASQLYATLLAALGNGQQSAEVATPRPLPPAATPSGLRILVAEDNPINQRVALRLLGRLGQTADVAADGVEVLRAVAQGQYDLVLMDIQMPEVDGVQATREIVRRRGAGGLPRIVAMTANAMPGDREAYIEAGMDGYLPKPIELVELAAVLTQAGLRARSPWSADATDLAIDRHRLESLRDMQDDSQPSLVRDLIDMFHADSATHVQSIIEAHARNDAAHLRSRAHRFLSATQNLGAHRLSALCARIEQCARTDRLPEVEALLSQLEPERQEVLAALASLRMRY